VGLLDWLLGTKWSRAAGHSERLATLGLSNASIEGGDRSPARERIADDFRWLFPPDDVHDSQAWDRYWNDQISHGLNPQIFDMFSDDRGLIAYMTSRGFRSVLCAGNGISQEPRALESAGFDVTALDLSPAAAQLAQAIRPGPDYLSMFADTASWRSEGTLKYVTADLLDAGVCPGPFDVIIERRTVQLFRGPEFGKALEALARRLRPDGLFLSHCHDGGWRPPTPPAHAAESWFREQGWTIWRGDLRTAPNKRVANLFMSTG
jgi:SAM-dependent methyltransferase